MVQDPSLLEFLLCVVFLPINESLSIRPGEYEGRLLDISREDSHQVMKTLQLLCGKVIQRNQDFPSASSTALSAMGVSCLGSKVQTHKLPGDRSPSQHLDLNLRKTLSHAAKLLPNCNPWKPGGSSKYWLLFKVIMGSIVTTNRHAIQICLSSRPCFGDCCSLPSHLEISDSMESAFPPRSCPVSSFIL